MKRREFNKAIATSIVILPFFSKVNANSAWSLEANLAECCSCEIPCPCNFGRATTKRCDGSRLIEIYKGNTLPRKIIFSGESLSFKNISTGLLKAVEFELLWLKSKRRYYHRVKDEDEKRILMLEKRVNAEK